MKHPANALTAKRLADEFYEYTVMGGVWPAAPVPRTFESEPVERRNVHTEHCCLEHGCKYGNADCPVVTKVKRQSFACERCGDDDEFLHSRDFTLGMLYQFAIERYEGQPDVIVRRCADAVLIFEGMC